MLTPKQKALMKKHKIHHSTKHIASMNKSMLAGKTFTQAHKIAMKKVGK
jgi:hypothetical protein